MLNLKTYKRFEKDFQRDRFSGKYHNDDFEELAKIVSLLSNKASLDKKYKDHHLKGEWRDFKECHIKPDWLLVYKIDKKLHTLNLARLGTHSQIFDI